MSTIGVVVAGLLVVGACACSTSSSSSTQAPAVDTVARNVIAQTTSPTVRSTTTVLRPATTVDLSSTTTTTEARRFVSGPFAVGSSLEVVTHGSPSRTLRVLLRYPAVGAAGHGVLAGASPRRNDGPYPLFVWMHGYQADPAYYESLLDAWAAAGYVVAAPTFPRTSRGESRADFDDYVRQPADVTAVLDRLLEDARSPGRILNGMIAPDLVAVGGHSLGAVTAEGLTEESCCVDPRVVAAVRISYGSEPFPNSRRLDRPVPQLFIHGSNDATFPVANSVRAFGDASGMRFLMILAGAEHTPFRSAVGPSIVRATTNFLDTVLKRRPGALDALLRDAQARGVPGRADSTP